MSRAPREGPELKINAYNPASFASVGARPRKPNETFCLSFGSTLRAGGGRKNAAQ